jgi:PAS domain S-box-containing protein
MQPLLLAGGLIWIGALVSVIATLRPWAADGASLPGLAALGTLGLLAAVGFVLQHRLWRARQAAQAGERLAHAAGDALHAHADILEAADVGTWEWTADDDDLRVNARAASLVGWPLERLRPLTRSKWLALAHPQDRQRAQAALAVHLRGDTPHYVAELRMRHWDGQWVWLLDRGRVAERDATGRPRRIVGTLTDITARAAAEQLWQARAEMSGDWFWQTDEAHRFSMVAGNRPAATGMASASLIGQRYDEVGSYDPPADGWTAFHARLDRREHIRGLLLRERWSHGEERWCEIDARPRYSWDGEFLGYEGVARDVTESRRVTLSLQESLSLIDALFQAIPIPVVMKDEHGRTVRLNRAYERFHRMPASRLLGSRTADVFEQRESQIQETEDHRLMHQGGVITREVRAQMADGRRPDVLLSKAAIAGVDGRAIGIVGTVVDISEQKAAAR